MGSAEAPELPQPPPPPPAPEGSRNAGISKAGRETVRETGRDEKDRSEQGTGRVRTGSLLGVWWMHTYLLIYRIH